MADSRMWGRERERAQYERHLEKRGNVRRALRAALENGVEGTNRTEMLTWELRRLDAWIAAHEARHQRL